MHKIFFLILLSLCSLNVWSKEIIIDDINYNVEENIEGDGYLYDYKHDTLYLDHYDGGSIRYDGELTIILKNKNIINGSKYDYGIRGNNILVRDDGELLIKNVSVGIMANILRLYATNIYMFPTDIGILVSSGDISLYSTKLLIETSGTGVFGNNLINVEESKINILHSNIGISSMSKLSFYVFGSELYIDSGHSLMNCYLFDIDNSKLYMHGSIDDNLVIVNHESNTLYGSNDGNNFFKIDNYREYRYLGINKSSENEYFNRKDIRIPFKEFVVEKEVETKDEYNDEYILEEISNPYTFDRINNYIYLLIISLSLLTIVVFIKGIRYGKN